MAEKPDELSLELAWRSWLPYMESGISYKNSGKFKEAAAEFGQAIAISAQFHPMYHFLESAIYTERGLLHRRMGNEEKAAKDFSRAIFLDHINYRAKAALAAEELPPYDKAVFDIGKWAKSSLPQQNSDSIHALYKKAHEAGDAAKSLKYYDLTLRLSDKTHLSYHLFAAEPWILRARVFSELGENDLAKNDYRRAKDLNRSSSLIEEALRRLAGEA